MYCRLARLNYSFLNVFVRINCYENRWNIAAHSINQQITILIQVTQMGNQSKSKMRVHLNKRIPFPLKLNTSFHSLKFHFANFIFSCGKQTKLQQFKSIWCNELFISQNISTYYI